MQFQVECLKALTVNQYQLIGHCLDRESALIWQKCWSSLYPHFYIRLTKPDKQNNPQWIIYDMGVSDKPRTIIQIERLGEAGQLFANILINYLSNLYGHKFALQEIKPGVKMRALAPDPVRPGMFVEINAGEMEVKENGLLVPADFRRESK